MGWLIGRVDLEAGSFSLKKEKTLPLGFALSISFFI